MSNLRNYQEDLKEIKGYEGKYFINPNGEIFSKTLKSIKKRKTSITKNGYESCILFKNNLAKSYLVHRLVAKTFLNNTDQFKYDEVNHKDYDKLNNHISNLEWSNSRLNNQHRSIRNKSKTSIFNGVHFHKDAKKWYSTISINGIKKYLGSFNSEIEARNNRVQFENSNNL